jgi:hypothetical protein
MKKASDGRFSSITRTTTRTIASGSWASRETDTRDLALGLSPRALKGRQRVGHLAATAINCQNEEIVFRFWQEEGGRGNCR